MTRNFQIVTAKLGARVWSLLAALILLTVAGFSQTPEPPQPPQKLPSPSKKIIIVKPKPNINQTGIPAEKFISVAENTNVSLCVNNGDVKITGWNRKEIRAVVEDGSLVGFKVLKRNEQQEPVWLKIVGFEGDKAGDARFDECLSGGRIEINMPQEATVSLKSGFGESFDTEIDSIARASVKNLNGDLIFDRVKRGIDAQTLTGDVRVQNSGGAIKIATMSGGVLIYNSQPAEVADALAAKTVSGSINLQDVSHSQIEISSTSGSINFSGSMSSGGQYSFSTNMGSITLNVPQNSSFLLNAIYGLGSFRSQLALENIVKTAAEFQRITGKFGQGEASLNVKTFNGSISINQSKK